MRYLTNQLGWIHDGFVHRDWVDHEGNGLMSRFSFGSTHDWQAPSGNANLFASEPVTAEMARLWIQRDQFTSLVSGDSRWTPFLSELLGVPVSPGEYPESEDDKFLIQPADVILRIGFAGNIKLTEEKWNGRFTQDLRDSELFELLQAEPELIRFYLHFVRKFNPAGAIKWDSGL